MSTMKAYTDLEQSKKLAEILPIDTADQCFLNDGTAIKDEINSYAVAIKLWKEHYIEIIPCWSLAALLSILPESIYDNTDEYSQLEFSKISAAYHDINDGIKVGSIKDNLVDACYELILKLHKLNLL